MGTSKVDLEAFMHVTSKIKMYYSRQFATTNIMSNIARKNRISDGVDFRSKFELVGRPGLYRGRVAIDNGVGSFNGFSIDLVVGYENIKVLSKFKGWEIKDQPMENIVEWLKAI